MFRVMLVDDEYLFREALKSSIPWEDLGYAVCCEAENGYDALDKFSEYHPDVAFVDINMPVMDGIDFLAEVFAKGYLLKTIIISGYSEFEYAKKAFKLGIEDYLLKPVDENELAKALQNIKEKLGKATAIEPADREQEIKADEIKIMKDTNSDKTVLLVKAFIKDNVSLYDLNIDKIACHVHMNYRYLCYLFKSKTGQTINEYITELRMKIARRLMDEGGISITLIAGKSGYADANYFGKCFKKYYGMTPSEYINTMIK